MKKDLEIANSYHAEPLKLIASKIGISEDALEYYGNNKAKISLKACANAKARRKGKLILVTGITPTPAGEGKTTTSVGLAQALQRCGKKVCLALREPSLGPIFGIKGGATGGGLAQVVPMDDINLHFTGDLHAVTMAHNFLASMIDNSLHQGNPLQLDPRQILFRRVIDLNDRALRQIVIGLGGKNEGVPRETGFDITATSEVMAILCLAQDIDDLKTRLGNIAVGFNNQGNLIFAKDLQAHGAMAMLLKEAIKPNLVQAIEGVPAFIHGGPFANIAHGCNSVMASCLGLHSADYLVTEAGFATELGGEKFIHIKCRASGMYPSAAVIVASLRALRHHGPNGKTSAEQLVEGLCNLDKHIENIKAFGIPIVVALNAFPDDTKEELQAVEKLCHERKVPVAISQVWEKGGEGGIELAKKVIDVASAPAQEKYLYQLNDSIEQKIKTIATTLYGAKDVQYSAEALAQLKKFTKLGFSTLPICMAKTQKSLSDNQKLVGRPKDFTLQIREIRLLAGAGFLVPICGSIMTMPGLPEVPAAIHVDLTSDGLITGLF